MSLASVVRLAASCSGRTVSRCSLQFLGLTQSSFAHNVISQPPIKSHIRLYASRSKTKSTADLVPGSKQALTSEAARLEYGKSDAKMSAAVEWYRKEVAGLETRASGRVTPALLSPVRIELPGKGKELVKLEEVATVGVRDGSTLIITVFEEHNLKAIEQALYAAKLPNIVPQRQDSTTIKIPIPRPTVEARNALTATAQRMAEDTRVQLRKIQQASIKKGDYKKHSIELEEFQKLADRNTTEVDKILAYMKKSTGTR
ncbi:ribosome recycling factor-domain-containing protein [Suillus clintonianus]|uniref:ribosome recycling factor-domain-containing protein n=1 Tax=Suillus clintonianus TaxID=1904413 RepID=UPI001B87A4D5|nr:ribosome recycling factor-domain-containing protein [Suillus clintonianus]KAG2122920.1 ribosome recycling factor-domain-containing protein [Suillus clintonianus]